MNKRWKPNHGAEKELRVQKSRRRCIQSADEWIAMDGDGGRDNEFQRGSEE